MTFNAVHCNLSQRSFLCFESMRTYSHFLITALIWDILERRQPPIRTGRGFLIGAVLPDVPLLLLTLWYLVYRLKSDCPPSENDPFYGPEYNNYFYNNNIWKLGTSLFHAPFLIMVYASFGAMISRFSQKWGHGIMWFAISCGLHSVLDIMTHVEDGVLVFFPFNWDYRSTLVRILVYDCSFPPQVS